MTDNERDARLAASEEIWAQRARQALADHDLDAAIAAVYSHGSDVARILASA